MKSFRCECGNQLHFENVSCLRCGRTLGFLPDVLELSALEPLGNDRWLALHPAAQGAHYHRCRHYSADDACNWMVPVADPEPYCTSCRLNQVIPNLDKPGNRALWLRIERRKRRLIYDLRRHRLPVYSKQENPQYGLAFAFLEDAPDPNHEHQPEFLDHHQSNQILTGHASGLITINIAEADDVQRERMRVQMNEQQRTLLGHFRHESGHYYWDLLVRDGPLLERVRALFGDERSDYAAALETHHTDGPKPDWQSEWVSAYASAHPWEDWAECWAHFLQIADALETAVSIGMAPAEALSADMDQRIANWTQLAIDINQLSRSMDQPDPYPFVLSSPVVEKLKLVNEIIGLSGHTG